MRRAAVDAVTICPIGVPASRAASGIAVSTEALVSVGSPATPFPQSWQNGPGVAIDPARTSPSAPFPDRTARFSWGNGSRLYYASLIQNLPDPLGPGFDGIVASAVSTIDGRPSLTPRSWPTNRTGPCP